METTLRAEIERFARESTANVARDGEPYFAAPLVGFAAATDPIFHRYKGVIGPFHLTPQEVMAAEFGGDIEAATVVCWVLPIHPRIRESNRTEDRLPSREWAETRTHGESFNGLLRRHMVEWLEKQGHRTVAPQFSKAWQELRESPVGIASTWSERHAAFAAGLGTFSLNDGLITHGGIAHRLGSVITTLRLPPSPRMERDHRHNCLYFREGTCGMCINRCPVGALSHDGHNKEICRQYVYETVPGEVAEMYGVKATGCGLCQTRVPCEGMIPAGRGR